MVIHLAAYAATTRLVAHSNRFPAMLETQDQKDTPNEPRGRWNLLMFLRRLARRSWRAFTLAFFCTASEASKGNCQSSRTSTGSFGFQISADARARTAASMLAGEMALPFSASHAPIAFAFS